MRTVGLGLLLYACGSPSPASIPVWYSLEVQGETVPILESTRRGDSSIRAVQLIIRRDPITDRPEWLSGHRYALSFYLEQLPIEIIVIETPWEDTAFYRAGAQVWESLFREWLSEDFLPFLRPYTQVRYVIFGRGLRHAPLSSSEWESLLSALKAQDTLRHWGFAAPHPDSIPCRERWDVLGIDYQLFYPPHIRPAYHEAWERAGKPLLLLYPNLYEPDTATALLERQRYWTHPPCCMIRNL